MRILKNHLIDVTSVSAPKNRQFKIGINACI